jgi:hypothetical protein
MQTKPNSKNMKKSILYAAVITTLIIAACKKKNDEPPVASLQNKWGIVSLNFQAIENGVSVDTHNYTGVAEDYIDFRSDNKVYSLIDGSEDTSDYQILNTNKVVIDVDTFDIQSLTLTSVKLYSKVYFDVNSYDENTINLKR